MTSERRIYGNDEFAAFGRRIVAAFARRVSDGDIEGLVELDRFARAADEAVGAAARALVAAGGYSWGDVARRLGTSRQNAHKRFAREVTR